jgi:hypothetical protein
MFTLYPVALSSLNAVKAITYKLVITILLSMYILHYMRNVWSLPFICCSQYGTWSADLNDVLAV